MKFLARPMLAVCFLLAGLLSWQRPAPFLFSVTPVDWAAEYEKANTPVETVWGAMEAAREMIRSSERPVPLTEFIYRNAGDFSILRHDDPWRKWHAAHFGTRDNGETETLYFRPSDLPGPEIEPDRGCIEIRTENSVGFLRFARIQAADFSGKNIPAKILYPHRGMATVFFGAGLALLIMGRFRGETRDLAGESSAGTGLKVSLAIMASGAAFVSIPFVNYAPRESPPYVFLGGFVVLCGTISLVLFAFQFSRLKKILKGEDLFAHWVYGREEWKRFVDWEYRVQKAMKAKLLLLVSVVIVVIGAAFRFMVRDDAADMVLLVLAGLIFLLWIVALVLPRLNYMKKSRRAGETLIGKSGVYVGGGFHSWDFPGSRLESARLSTDPMPVLTFEYSYLTLAGRSMNLIRQSATVSVPIPEGKEKEAGSLVRKIAGSKLSSSADHGKNGCGPVDMDRVDEDGRR